MDTKQIKVATTQHDVIDLIKNRFSPRAFSAKEITLATVNTILEAGTWAPSAANEQPWRYTVALKNNEPGFKKLLNVLMPGNTPWAQNAAALVLCTAKLTYSQNEKQNVTALHDAGMANQNILLQALSMDVYAHIMGGFDKAKAIEAFNITADFESICVIAFGYLGDRETLIEPFKEREKTPRVRKPLTEVVTYL